GNQNPSGITPTIVRVTPDTSIRLPTIDGSLPRSRHNEWLSTTTGSAPGRSSPARKPAPITGRTPSTSNSPADASIPRTSRAGPSRICSVTSCDQYAATASNPVIAGRRYTNSVSDHALSAQKTTTSSSARTGSGSSSSGLATPYTAAIPATPSESVSTANPAYVGRVRSRRNA